MMEPISIAQNAVELWGPVGGLVAMIMVAGWMALKWLANRDDNRNEQSIEEAKRTNEVLINLTREVMVVVEGCKSALANNTAALHENGRAMQETISRIANMESTIEAYFMVEPRGKLNGKRRNA